MDANTYTPFTPCVDDPIAQHQSASSTYEIPATELLNDVGTGISAIRADKSHGKIWPKGGLLNFLDGLRERERL